MVSMCSSESFQLQTPEKNLTTIIADSQRELKRISSKENNSLLRTLNKNSLASFSMELVSAEMHRVMPTFTEYIENTIKNPRQSRNKLKKGKFVEPEIVSSTAKLLHIFNRDLNLFQSLNSIILLKGGCKQSAFNRLSSTGSCMSYKSTLAMVDKLAINWSKELTDWKVRVETDSEMEIKIFKQLDDLDDAIDFMFSQDMPIEGLMMELEEMQQSLAKHRKSMHPGYYFVGDNIDMKTSVRQMTNQNQRKDHHMFNICAFMNRIDGNMLDNTTAKADIRSIPFSTFIPNENDQEQLLENFAFLIAHIWCDFIPWLYPYKCTLPQYITHEHINDTKKKTQRVSLINTEHETDPIKSYSLFLSILGNFTHLFVVSCFFQYQLKIIQEKHQNDKQFGSRSGQTFC